MRPASPHTARICRVALVAIVAALWGANPVEAASGCCRPERKAAAPCCCRPAKTRTVAAVANTPQTDAVRTPPACRCLPAESAPADRSGSVVVSDPPSERVADLDAASVQSPESADFNRFPHRHAKPSRTPLYLRLSRLRT